MLNYRALSKERWLYALSGMEIAVSSKLKTPGKKIPGYL